MVDMGKEYKVLKYIYGKERDKECELHNQLALRKIQRDEFIRIFTELRTDVELKNFTYLRLLIDVESMEKGAKSINSFDEAMSKCVNCECLSRILDASTHSWKASVIKLKK